MSTRLETRRGRSTLQRKLRQAAEYNDRKANALLSKLSKEAISYIGKARRNIEYKRKKDEKRELELKAQRYKRWSQQPLMPKAEMEDSMRALGLNLSSKLHESSKSKEKSKKKEGRKADLRSQLEREADEYFSPESVRSEIRAEKAKNEREQARAMNEPVLGGYPQDGSISEFRVELSKTFDSLTVPGPVPVDEKITNAVEIMKKKFKISGEVLRGIFNAFAADVKQYYTVQEKFNAVDQAAAQIIKNKYKDPSILAADLTNYLGIVSKTLGEATVEERKMAEMTKESELKALKQEIEDKTSELIKRRNEINDLEFSRQKLSDEIKGLNDSNAALTKDYNKKYGDLERSYQKIDQTRLEYEKQLEATKKALTDIQTKYAENRTKLEQFERLVNEQGRALQESGIDAQKLQEKIVLLKTTLQGYTQKEAEFAAAVAKYNEDLAAFNRGSKDIQTQLDNQAAEIDRLQKANDALVQEKQAQLQTINAQQTTIDQLQSEINARDTKITTYEAQIRVLNEGLEEKNREIANLRASGLAVTEQQKQAETMTQNYLTQISQLKSEITSLKSANKDAQTTIYEYEVKYKQAKSDLAVASSKIRDFETIKAAQQGQYSSALVQIQNNFNNEKASLEAKLSDSTKQIASLTSQLHSAQIRVNDLTAEYKKLETNSKGEIGRLTAENLKLKSENEQLRQLDQELGPMVGQGVVGAEAGLAAEVAKAAIIPPVQALKILSTIDGWNNDRKRIGAKRVASIAQKKSKLDKVGGYIVGGRPDPDFNSKYWRAKYLQGFRLF